MSRGKLPPKSTRPMSRAKPLEAELPKPHSRKHHILVRLLKGARAGISEIQRFMASAYDVRNDPCAEMVAELLADGLIFRDSSSRYFLSDAVKVALTKEVEAQELASATPPPYRPGFRPLKAVPVMRCMREGAEEYKSWASVG